MQQRLFEIVWLLTRTGGATADELARRFGVSRRTIYRDIDALSGAGIPVYTEKGRGGGVRLLPDFVLDKAHFSMEERAELIANLDSLASIGTPDADKALEKLSALFGRQESWLEVDFAPWAGGDAMRQLFRLLRGAILQRHVVDFLYTGANGAPGPRRVQPYRVLFRGQGWYLYAWCLAREDFRYFKLNRIQHAEDSGELFTPRALPQPGETATPTELISVTLRLSADAAFRALDEFSPEQLRRTEDGGYIAEGLFPPDGWLLGYILSFGPHAEVLQPPFLRRQVREALAQTAQYYEHEAD